MVESWDGKLLLISWMSTVGHSVTYYDDTVLSIDDWSSEQMG